MVAQTLGSLILWLIILAIAIVIAVYLLRWLYQRSTKETAFVRTGFGGEKVVVSGGAFVIPVLHDITPVNMSVTRIEVARRETQALITKNRMRVDIIAEFFVKVDSSREAVSFAAQTLGRRTLQADGTRDLLEGRFASALRTVAAQMTLEQMHEQRQEYAQRVKTVALEGLSQNGLHLESVAIVDLDQTHLEFFDSSNAFDAEGLTQLTETIESRRRMRNEIEQRTQIEIRTQNLDAQRKSLEIDREGEYARLAQEQDIEVRRTAQRVELARDRAVRDQESEQALLAAREEVEKSKFVQERNLAEARIQNQEDIEQREIARRRHVDEVEMKTRELTEREQIVLELALEKARIQREREQSELELDRRRVLELAEINRQIVVAAKNAELAQAESERKRTEIVANQDVESTRIAQERVLDQARIERERLLDALNIAKRQAFEEAEISSGEEIERARIATERGLAEARVARDGDLRKLEVERDKSVQVAEIDSVIEIAKKSAERSAAIAIAETARAQAVAAEEQAFTVRETEIAHRRKATDLIAAARETERDALRLTGKAEAERAAATSFADAVRIAAQGEAEAEKIKALAAAERYEVDAKGAMQLNEAENTLSESARLSRFRGKLLERIEGIVRESVRPMEKIEGIKILHIDGANGAPGANRNVTDEVIDSALRYRVQAPMIDSLMKEIGIEGGSLGRMTEVLRDAKDIESLASKRTKPAHGATPANGSDRDDER
ncbi:MAG TPA: flotillin domain-containing protein [Roseiarcus sp.]|nr:flotillin domain-containing protein [Roseiarcus sp.]